jgi:hypothetical protein
MSRHLAASIRARLKQRADAAKRDFNRTLTHYGLERLLFRLSISDHADRFLLKGAQVAALVPPREKPPEMTQLDLVQVSRARRRTITERSRTSQRIGLDAERFHLRRNVWIRLAAKGYRVRCMKDRPQLCRCPYQAS